MKLYSDEQLLNRLQKFVSEFGRPPSQNEVDDSGPRAARTHADRFGPWDEALETAGPETGTTEPDGRPPTPEENLLQTSNQLPGT